MLQRVNSFRAAEKPGEAEAPPPTPAFIATSVPRTREHEALAAKIEQLAAEREHVIAEMRSSIASNSGELNDSQIRRLQKRRLEIELKLTEMRISCRPLREAHAARIGEALDPSMRDDALTMLRCSTNFRAWRGA